MTMEKRLRIAGMIRVSEVATDVEAAVAEPRDGRSLSLKSNLQHFSLRLFSRSKKEKQSKEEK